LVALDDLHEKSQFYKFISDTSLLALKNLIIVTSCDQHLLRIIARKTNFHLYEVSLLEWYELRRLFNLYAFYNEKAPNSFMALADGVSNACSGLPQTLKVVGSSLFDKKPNED
jgi:hypothetical protein